MTNETPPFPAGLAQPAPLRQDSLAEPTPLGFGRTLTPDPVDAAIERHRAARQGLEHATKGVDAAMTASKQAEAEADAAFSAASNADGAAWADLIATRPGDVSGAVRLLRYVSDSPASEVVEDPQDLLRQLAAVVEAAEAGGERGGLSAGPHPMSGTAANLDRTVAALDGLAGPAELDPALAVVAEFRDAWDALGKAVDAAGGVGVPEVDPAIEDREGEAYEQLKAVRPTTPEGFRALAGAWAMVLGGERGGEPGIHHADHAADSLITGAGVCVPIDPVAWHSPPLGFMASLAIEPFGFVIIEEGIRIELERLRDIALDEFARRTNPDAPADRIERLRRTLRLDALEKAVRGEGGFAVSTGRASPTTFQEWQAEAARHPGLVPFPAHAPRILLALDEAIQREAGRLLELAEAEVERTRADLAGNPDPTLWPRVEQDLRREMRMDALALVAADIPDDGAPDPVLAAIAASRRAEAEMAAFLDGLDGSMTPEMRAREDALCDAQNRTRAAVWATVPTTRAGRLALVHYAGFQAGIHVNESGGISDAPALFTEILAPIAAAITAERPDALGRPVVGDLDAAALVSAIEAEWRVWASLDGRERDDVGDRAFDASLARRDALLDAAEALSAGSREAMQAKALARVWMDWVEEDCPGQARDAYDFDGRLAFDINASFTAASLPGAASRVASAGAEGMVYRILATWAALARAEDASDDELSEALLEHRAALLREAERLPVAREHLVAKALAFAWIGHAHLWRIGQAREDYAIDGRLALDIEATARRPLAVEG